VAWIILGLYVGYATLVASPTTNPLLLFCRFIHAVTLALNVVLSDDLHNLDRDMAGQYTAVRAMTLEQTLHAHDWRAALSLPASYHLLLVLGIMDPGRVELADKALLCTNLALYSLMCYRIAPRRMTPARELFLSFVATFGVQMGLLLAAFWREREHHPLWPYLWLVYAVGLVAKGLECPTSDTFGHHEVLHAAVIVGNALGLLVDTATT